MKLIHFLNKYKKTIIVGLLFIVFVFIRVYNLHNRIIFDWDQEQFSNQIMDLIRNHKPTLLGPRVTDVRGFFLAPYFTYILVPFYLITNLNPMALVIFVVVINIVFFILAYVFLKKAFSWGTAIIFLIIWTFSSYHAGYDTIPWWPIMLPLGAVCTWWSLWLIRKKSSLKNWMYLGLTLALFIHMHFQFIFAVLFAIIFILLSKPKKYITYSLFSIGILIVFLAPLVLFDFRHEFLNSHLFINYFLKGTGEPKDLFIWQVVFANAAEPFTAIRSVVLAWLFYASALILTFVTMKNEPQGYRRNFFTATLWMWLSIPLVFALYGKRPSEYYFLILFPCIYVVIAHFVARYVHKFLIAVVVIVFIASNTPRIIQLFHSNANGLAAKNAVIQKVGTIVETKTFSISFDGPPNMDTGFRYLLKLYYYPVSEDPKVPMIGVHIPVKPGDVRIGIYGITVPTEFSKK